MDQRILIAIVLGPLIAATITGLSGRRIGRAATHWLTSGSVFVSFVLSCLVLKQLLVDGVPNRTTARSTPGSSATASAWKSGS